MVPTGTYAFAAHTSVSGPSSRGISAANGFNNGVEIHPYAGNTADIHMPTQHTFLGVNMTALSEGNFIQRAGYNIANGFNIFAQVAMFRSVGDSSMRNLDGSATTTQEGVLGFSSAATSLLMRGMNSMTNSAGASARTLTNSGPLKNISGNLDAAASLARNQPYGSSGNTIVRRLPRTAQDAQALIEVQSGMGRNPNLKLGDPRYQGWEKWHHSVGPKGNKSVVHYLRDPNTGFLTDFKFK